MTRSTSTTTAPTAADLMTSKVLTLDPGLPVGRALARLGEYEVGGAPVVDAGGHVLGVFSARDVSRNLEDVAEVRGEVRTELGGEDYEDTPFAVEDSELSNYGDARVSDWMTTELATVAPSASLRDVCRGFVERRVHRLLVLDGGRLVGIVSTMDVARHFAK